MSVTTCDEIGLWSLVAFSPVFYHRAFDFLDSTQTLVDCHHHSISPSPWPIAPTLIVESVRLPLTPHPLILPMFDLRVQGESSQTGRT